MIELIFENVEVGIIPTEHCRLYAIRNKIIYLEFPLNKITYQTYGDIVQDRILQYDNIVYVEKDGKRYDVNWESESLIGEENKLQHSELLENGNVIIYWEANKW